MIEQNNSLSPIEVVAPCAALDDWFADHILIHDAALTRFLQRAWRNAAEVPDFRQEAYVRVYEAANKERPTAPKALLFTTARHLLIDRARQQRVVAIGTVSDCDALNILVDEISPEERASSHQELRQLAEAFDRLPNRCRDTMWLRMVEGLSQKEIANRLSISEKMVEKHLARGMQRLAEELYVPGTPWRGALRRQPHSELRREAQREER